MVELVDTRDLKSLDRNIVPVQVRPRVPYNLVMKDWLIATYKINEIKRLECNLSDQNFNYYIPRITKKKINFQPKEEVLFPGYIFINTSSENYSALRYTKGIKNVVKFGNNIALISDQEIKAMRIAEKKSRLDPISSRIKIGQDAIIAKGTLKGSIVKICSLSSNERVSVLLSFLGSLRTVTISKKDLIF